MKITRFENLNIWKISLKITKEINDLSANPQFSKDYGLKDQIRRAIISVTSNIVKGFEKNNNNEFVRYLRISKGSVGEVRNQLYIALSVEYISQKKFEQANTQLEELAKQIGKFIVYLQSKKKNNSSTR